jgi:hypothetical protein
MTCGRDIDGRVVLPRQEIPAPNWIAALIGVWRLHADRKPCYGKIGRGLYGPFTLMRMRVRRPAGGEAPEPSRKQRHDWQRALPGFHSGMRSRMFHWCVLLSGRLDREGDRIPQVGLRNGFVI